MEGDEIRQNVGNQSGSNAVHQFGPSHSQNIFHLPQGIWVLLPALSFGSLQLVSGPQFFPSIK